MSCRRAQAEQLLQQELLEQEEFPEATTPGIEVISAITPSSSMRFSQDTYDGQIIVRNAVSASLPTCAHFLLLFSPISLFVLLSLPVSVKGDM
jgi:hypothetical protein